MKLQMYSSLAAFLAHWRALERAGDEALDDDERARLAAIVNIAGALRPEERAALNESADDNPTVVRHRQRAELRLARELRARGLLAP